jgi:iron complex outermembrane receptor protein
MTRIDHAATRPYGGGFGSRRKQSRHFLANGAATGLVLASLTLGIAAPAFAQEASAESESGVADIVVTAQRREQNLQDVPIAITAFSGEAIERADLNAIDKLSGQVPGLKIAIGADRTNLAIRGIGTNITNIAAESGVAVNIDGVYLTRTTLTGATFSDLAQMEVLRGPQGTLYGRNATGGALNITTRTPDGTFDGNFSALVGNGGRFRVRGAVGIPISGETLSARVSADYETLSGYRYNLTRNEKADPEDHLSGRIALRWAPSEALEVILRASISDDSAPNIIQFGASVPGPFNPIRQGGQTSQDPRNIRNDSPSSIEFKDQIYSATISYDLGGVTLKSVTAYQKHRFAQIADVDGTSLLYATVDFLEDSPATTQELTLSGSSSAFDWVVGAWYMDDEARALMRFQLPGVGRPPFAFDYTQKTKAFAVFGQATYSVTDSLRVTAGLRYSEEKKTLFQILPGPPGAPGCPSTVNKYDDLSPKFGIDFDLAENVMIYASATKGFKAGGGNVSVCGNIYAPEELWAYEAGIKSQWLDNRVRLNLNGYYYDYTGYQASQLVNNPAPTAIITNAASAKVKGIEGELLVEPINGLTLSVNAAWADSEFGNFVTTAQFGGPPVNVTGNRLALTPEFSGNLAAQYETPVGDSGLFTIRFEHNWSSSFFFDPYNNPLTGQGAYGRSNARIAYGFEAGSLKGLEISAFVNNIQDKDILNRADGSGIFGGTRLSYERPRTFGAEMRYRF